MKILLLWFLATVSAFGQLPTGTLTFGAVNTTNCSPGYVCQDFTVQCPNVIDNHPVGGTIAKWQTIDPLKTIAFLSGHNGSAYWNTTAMSQSFLQQVHDESYDIVLIKWKGNGWPNSWGYPQGFVNVACREATALKWLYDNRTGTGDFIVVGGSEGSAALGYAMAAYDADSFIGLAVLISGPPMADIADGCMQPTNPAYRFNSRGEAQLVDQPFGFAVQPGVCGPCCQQDNTWIPEWIANSVETCGNNFYPNTRVQFIVGNNDSPIILNHARKYYDALSAMNQPNLSWQNIQMGHSIQQSQAGLDFLYNVITQ